MEDWALIRRLAAEGVPKAAIARWLGIARNTVTAAVASDAPPKYRRKPASTSFTPFEPRVRALLAETADMPATVLAERVGWTGSIRWFRDNVNRVRADHRPIDPADRLSWTAGDAAQCDLWFPPRKILLEDGSRALLPVLVMTGDANPENQSALLRAGANDLVLKPIEERLLVTKTLFQLRLSKLA